MGLHKFVAVGTHGVERVNDRVKVDGLVILIADFCILQCKGFISLPEVDVHGHLGGQQLGGGNNLNVLRLDLGDRDVVNRLRARR